MSCLVEAEFPTVVWTPCASHCPDMLMEDIGKLRWVKKVVKRPVKNQVAKAIVERIIRAGAEGKKFRIVVVIPEVPGFAGQSGYLDQSVELGFSLRI